MQLSQIDGRSSVMYTSIRKCWIFLPLMLMNFLSMELMLREKSMSYSLYYSLHLLAEPSILCELVWNKAVFIHEIWIFPLSATRGFPWSFSWHDILQHCIWLYLPTFDIAGWELMKSLLLCLAGIHQWVFRESILEYLLSTALLYFSCFFQTELH